MKRAMERMNIDEGIRDVVKTLWKHGYHTIYSCQGHEPSERDAEGTVRYVSYKTGTGDGWFEENGYKLGFIGYDKSKLGDPVTKKLVPAVAYYSRN